MQNSYIPNIDISSLISSDFNDDSYKNVAKEIKKASEEIGFFTVTGHGISNAKIDKLLSTCRHFFHSPDKEKLKIAPKKWNPNTNTVYRGYFPSSVNGKEGLDIGDPQLSDDMKDLLVKEKFEVNHDMSYLNPEWQIVIDDYYNSIFELGMRLFKSIISVYSSNLDLADKAFIRPKTLSTLRFNFYPKQEKPVEISEQDGVALGCETHVDSGIMTILYQDKKGGLQVQNRHTLEWHEVPHDPNAVSRSLLTLVVPVAAPMSTAVAAPNAFTVVAFVFNKLNVVWFVVISPPSTFKSRSTSKLLLILVVPVDAPMSIAVALPPKLIVVAVSSNNAIVVLAASMHPPW